MGKSLGITAFVLLLISLPIPIFGNYLSLLAVLILSLSAFQGEKRWVVITSIIAWVKMFLLSPTWHAMMFGGGYMRNMGRGLESTGAMDSGLRALRDGSTRTMEGLNSMTLFITLIILSAPLVIMFWRSRTAAAPAIMPTDRDA